MPGLGTIINVAAIAAGGMGGLLFGRKMEKRYQDTLMSANAVCVLFLGIAGCMEQMLKITQNGLASGGTMMMIGSLAIGALLGEWLNLDYHMEQFGEWLKRKTGNEKDAGFVDGFVTASLTVCVGAMAVVGSIRDGIYGDYSILAAKAVLDLIIVLVMTASMGKGCIFSAVPVGIFQGILTLLAFADRINADLLCRREPALGKEDQGGKPSARYFCGGGVGVPAMINLLGVCI